MDTSYVKAIETRSRWLTWSTGEGADIYNPSGMKYIPGYMSYVKCLEAGDTYFMNKKFCNLIENARATVPDDLTFESSWMQSPQGWMWIEEPFEVPWPAEVKETSKSSKPKPKIAAVGWLPVPEGQTFANYMDSTQPGRMSGKGAYQFLCFMDLGYYKGLDTGFNAWSYFMIQDGDKLITRIRDFESGATKEGGAYSEERISDMMHEMRWIYSSFYMMAQRLSITVHHNTDRATKRRAEREKRTIAPFFKVVTLRRYEEERKKAEASGNLVNWQCQWEVVGHWRNQYYPSTAEYKQKWIESYVKGPPDKPFKAPSVKVFVARR
jgi:hypothetical protein